MLHEMGVRVWLPLARARTAGGVDGLDVRDVARADHAANGPPATQPADPRAAPPTVERGVQEPWRDTPHDLRARADRIAAMDWSTLRESAAACTACELHRGRTHSVFASAPGQADWLVVGDPPSADDDLEGVPIAGDAGRLLDNMLAAAQLSRASTALQPMKACVTNIVKCRPPNDRPVDAGEIARCAPYLQRQIDLVRPKVVFAMGRCAAQGLVSSVEPIGKLRGSVHRHQGVAVVATFHPSHLARHPADKAKAWDDLCRAAGRSTACLEFAVLRGIG